MLVCNETAAHTYNQCYVDPIIQGSDSAPVCGVYITVSLQVLFQFVLNLS